MPGMKATMEEYKAGALHSGSKTGPVVKNRAQAIAIGMNEAGKAKPNGKSKGGKRHAKAHAKAHAKKKGKGKAAPTRRPIMDAMMKRRPAP